MSFAASAARRTARYAAHVNATVTELTMSDFDELYGSKDLSATDLKAPVDAIIERVDFEEFTRPGEKPRKKAVVYFKNASKPMVLNKTNATTLATAFGKPFAGWIGKRVTVRAEQTVFAGKPTLGLRIYPVANGRDRITSAPIVPPEPPYQQPPPRQTDDMNDEIPW